jgi:hypothetical protein
MVERNKRQHIINTPPDLARHLEVIVDKERFLLKERCKRV